MWGIHREPQFGHLERVGLLMFIYGQRGLRFERGGFGIGRVRATKSIEIRKDVKRGDA